MVFSKKKKWEEKNTENQPLFRLTECSGLTAPPPVSRGFLLAFAAPQLTVPLLLLLFSS